MAEAQARLASETQSGYDGQILTPRANPDRTAYLLLTLTALFWGGNSVAGRFAVGEISPMLLTFARWALASVIILSFGSREIAADMPVIRQRWLWLATMAAMGFAVFNFALYSALQWTTAVNASVVQAAMPAIVFLFSLLLFGQRTSAAQVAGFFVTLAGIAVIVTAGDLSKLLTLEVNAGDALVLLAIAIYGIYTVALRNKPAMHWKSLLFALSLFAALASIPFVIGEWLAGRLIAPGATGWTVVAYTVIFPSILAQQFWIRGVEMIGANRAGLFINLVPLFGTGLAILLLGERLHAFHAVALALVLGGIALAEMSARRR